MASLMVGSPGDVRREVELHEHGCAESGDDGPPVDRDSFRLRWHLRTPPGKGSARPRAACARATNARPRHGPLRVQLKGECLGSSPMGLRAQPARGADATTRASDHPRHASWVTATRGAVKSDRRSSQGCSASDHEAGQGCAPKTPRNRQSAGTVEERIPCVSPSAHLEKASLATP
jgi:hypothetical protein